MLNSLDYVTTAIKSASHYNTGSLGVCLTLLILDHLPEWQIVETKVRVLEDVRSKLQRLSKENIVCDSVDMSVYSGNDVDMTHYVILYRHDVVVLCSVWTLSSSRDC